jgi:hypothetical protein
MEGMGGMDFEQGEDYQLGNYMGGSGAPESLRQRMMDNMEGIREMMQDNISLDGEDYDDYDADEDYSSTMSDSTEMLDRIMTGGIRLQPDMIKEISEKIPYLQNKDNVMSLIKRLYQNMGVEDEEEDTSEVGQMLQSIKKPQFIKPNTNPGIFTLMGMNAKARKAFDSDD